IQVAQRLVGSAVGDKQNIFHVDSIPSRAGQDFTACSPNLTTTLYTEPFAPRHREEETHETRLRPPSAAVLPVPIPIRAGARHAPGLRARQYAREAYYHQGLPCANTPNLNTREPLLVSQSSARRPP